MESYLLKQLSIDLTNNLRHHSIRVYATADGIRFCTGVSDREICRVRIERKIKRRIIEVEDYLPAFVYTDAGLKDSYKILLRREFTQALMHVLAQQSSF